MDIQIRKAKAEDTHSITEILRALGWFAHLNSEPLEATQRRVARHLESCHADDSHTVYVAEDSAGAVVGYAAVHWLPYMLLAGPEGYVSELFIQESARGKGAGTKLLEVIEAEAKGRGCSRLMLLNLRQRESYQREFYKKHGWEERPGVANFVRKLLQF